jgi:hypothetical protein
MTYSIFIHFFSMSIAALFAAAILWAEHYHPWETKLDPRWNYVLGTVAMLLPYSLLLMFMIVVPPADLVVFGLLALVGLWFIVAVSGATVYALHERDAKKAAQERAIAAEAAERLARDESTQSGS